MLAQLLLGLQQPKLLQPLLVRLKTTDHSPSATPLYVGSSRVLSHQDPIVALFLDIGGLYVGHVARGPPVLPDVRHAQFEWGVPDRQFI